MRLHLSAALSVALTLTLTTPAFAGPIEDGQAILKAASADTAKLTAALDIQAVKLKDPSQAESLKPLVKQCAASFAKAWKNALGVPLYRDKVGWAVFKVKGDPFCQARSFSLSEPYKGGGRYQKDRSVSFGSVRWQKCM